VDQHRKNEILQAQLQVMESSTLSLTDSVTDALVKYVLFVYFLCAIKRCL